MTTTNTPEKAISLAIKREILYDINNGLFCEDESNSKYYRDEENDLEIEVFTEIKSYSSMWQFTVLITDDYGDQYELEEGQWQQLYKAHMAAADYFDRERESEARYIKYLGCYC